MDLQLKQWRIQQQNESEEQSYATKMSKSFSHQIQSQTATSATALPLFVPEPTTSSSFSCFSPDSSSSRLLKMGNLFSLAQWQELELQALIYRYMLAGASVPQELLLPIKKSLFHQSHLNFLHYPLQHNFPHHQPWYWGRGAVDPEPGRCKRTDGKKWRCSRDVVASYKYCDRHIHRGRNRSRKPVETTTNAATNAASSFALGEKLGQGPDNLFFSSSSSHSSTQHLHLNSHQSCSSEMKQESNNKKRPYEAHNNGRTNDGHILRHFFEDWPQSSDSTSRPMSSSTCHHSISMPSYASSDVSLKLSTCNEEEEANMINNNNNEKEHQQNMNCLSSGGNDYNMDGPLAEALRSASPTSSLLQQMGISTQEMKYVKPLRLLGDALKTKVSVPGRFLGLDVGDKYVGLAVSDPSNMIASPLSVLLRKKTNIDLMATDFQNLVKSFSVSGLVVGYPFGKLNNVEDVVIVNLFIEELRKTEKLKDVKYTYWDERLSSKTVELMLKPLKLHPVQEKTMLDKFAAVVILQEYLDYANRYVKTEPEE
uniref:Growth-regulating factor n=1 Tax=Brassica campestris TaxID=3711 RepID=M4DSZ7_BRACM